MELTTGANDRPRLLVNMTPTPDLAIRILETYRQGCDTLWVMNSGDTSEESPDEMMRSMNEHQHERAKLLDAAIAKLREGE